MIVPMKHVSILCVSEAREDALARMRDLGLVHLNADATDSEPLRTAQALLAQTDRALLALDAARAGKHAAPALAAPHKAPGHVKHLTDLLSQKLPAVDGAAADRVGAVLRLADLRQELVNEADRLNREIERYAPFGSFDALQARQLIQGGIALTLFRAPLHTPPRAPEGAFIEVLAVTEEHVYGALIGGARPSEPCEVIELPEADVQELRQRHEQALARIARIDDALRHAADDASLFRAEKSRLEELCEFAAAAASMRAAGPVAWISGWVAANHEPLLRETAAEQAWGLLVRDPLAGEAVPTLLRPPRPLRPMLSLFKALGISPAYHEADVSLPFFCFFSIFFAMLVGDGGYGVLILLLTWRVRQKLPRAPAAPFILLTIFALATVVWGGLSNTWFGFHPHALDNAFSRWLSQPGGKGDGNMMLICFTLGVAHLSVARIWNAFELFPDRKFLAQVGWLGVIWFMYFLAGSIVGVLTLPAVMKPVFGVSIALIALFMLRKDELRTNGADLGMLPLTIIGCLGDIISYVRLFAVGLAGVKVAENFNEMALSLDLPMVVKAPCLVLILLFGHALNFAMAGLSVLVHAVRLNTLEFSNHKGVSWAGFTFSPFRRRADGA